MHFRGHSDAPFPLDEAEEALAFARGHYLAEGDVASLGGCAFLLAQVQLRRLRKGVSPETFARVHEAASSLIAEAMEQASLERSPEAFALRREIAAEILALGPRETAGPDFRTALTYLAEAAGVHARAGDRASAYRCGMTALDVRRQTGRQCAPAQAAQMEHLLLGIEAWYREDEVRELTLGPTLSEAAACWLEAAHSSEAAASREAFARAEALARRIVALAAGDAGAATAVILCWAARLHANW